MESLSGGLVMRDVMEAWFGSDSMMCDVFGQVVTMREIKITLIVFTLMGLFMGVHPVFVSLFTGMVQVVLRQQLVPWIHCWSPAPTNVAGGAWWAWILVPHWIVIISGIFLYHQTRAEPIVPCEFRMPPRTFKAMAVMSARTLIPTRNVGIDIIGAAFWGFWTGDALALAYIFNVYVRAGAGSRKTIRKWVGLVFLACGCPLAGFLLLVVYHMRGSSRKKVAMVVCLVAIWSAACTNEMQFACDALEWEPKWRYYGFLCHQFLSASFYLVVFVLLMFLQQLKKGLPFFVMVLLPVVGAKPIDLWDDDPGILSVFGKALISIFSWWWSMMAYYVWATAHVGWQRLVNMVCSHLRLVAVSAADVTFVWLCFFMALCVVRKRVTLYGGLSTLWMLRVLHWFDLMWYWYVLIFLTVLLNLVCIGVKTYPKFCGLWMLMFLTSVYPAQRFLLDWILWTDYQVPHPIYLFVYFGTLVLEFAPLFAKQTLVITKDPKTCRILKQERVSGVLTQLIFGDVSVEWDSLFASAKIGLVHEASWFRNIGHKIRHLNVLLNSKAILDLGDAKDVEIVRDARATGYIKHNGRFMANCQAVVCADRVAILANIHAVHQDGFDLNMALFCFPGQGIETKAVPAVSFANTDLALLSSEKPLKCAWQLEQRSVESAIVMGWNDDCKPFQKIVQRPRAGKVQCELRIGHSGCALVSETGRLIGILWLTSGNANVAYFVGVSPLVMTTKVDLEGWSQASVLSKRNLVKANLDEVREKMKLKRRRILADKAEHSPELARVEENLISIEQQLNECDEARVADLVAEHYIHLRCAQEALEEKKPLLARLKLLKTEKDKLLAQRSRLRAVDTSVVAELRKEARRLQAELDELNGALKEEYAFVESRMPLSKPQVKWPVVYRDDAKKWHIHWSADEEEVLETSPVMNDKVLLRVQEETGLTRKMAQRHLANHLYNETWGQKLVAEARPSCLVQWWDWLMNRPVHCMFCDREFVCNEIHKHGPECRKAVVLNMERHRDYCSSNCLADGVIHVEGWSYPFHEGRICLGYGRHIIMMCGNPTHGHSCVTNTAPLKRGGFFKLNSKNGELWLARVCVEGLHKAYNDVDIPMPENETVLRLIEQRNELKKQLSASNAELEKRRAIEKKTDEEMLKLVETRSVQNSDWKEEAAKLRSELLSLKQQMQPSGMAEKKAVVDREVMPFVAAPHNVHSKWVRGPCACHLCACRDECKCPLALCVWCNVEGHYTQECELAKKEHCSLCGSDCQPGGKGKVFCCENDCICVICGGKHHAMKCSVRDKKSWFKTRAPKMAGEVDWVKCFQRPDFHKSPTTSECGWGREVRENLRMHAINGVLTMTYTGGLFSRAVRKLVPPDLVVQLACTPTTLREKIMAMKDCQDPLVSFSEANCFVDPLDLEKGTGIFEAECDCGNCVENFLMTTLQSSVPPKDLRKLVHEVLGCEDVSCAVSGMPGPGFELDPQSSDVSSRWPYMPPYVILQCNWKDENPSATGISPMVGVHTGRVTEEMLVPQKSRRPIPDYRYRPCPSERFPSVRALRSFQEPSDYQPSNTNLGFAFKDIMAYDVEVTPLSGRVNEEALMKAIDSVLGDLSMVQGSFPKATFDEVCSKRKWNTSCGYPYNAKFKSARAAFEVMNEVIQDSMRAMYKGWAPTLWNIIAKDEVLPVAKAQNKVRTILGPSICHQLVSQMLTLNIVEHQNLVHSTSHSQLGSSKFHGQFHLTMSRFGGPVVEYDMSGWDRHVHPTLLKIMHKIFWCLLDTQRAEDWVALSNVFESMIYSYMVYPNGQVVRKHGGMPSGCTLTASVNTMIHMLLQEYARVVVGGPQDYICYGDDGLMTDDGTSAQVMGVFSMFGMSKVKALHLHGSIVGATWLGSLVGKVGNTYVPVGNPRKAVASIYWSAGYHETHDKPLGYEFAVAYSVYSELLFCPTDEVQGVFDYLQELALEILHHQVGGVIEVEGMLIDVPQVAKEVVGVSHNEFRAFMCMKFFSFSF
uniref:RNA-dependent RNA polymerase n=1 Tax=Wuhan astro-like virus TaxID=2116423 RepID=A0A2P1GMA8_9VIRU|nr:RNA-dependent RNA polymerase [Wuhan astro-like virus]